MCGRFSLFQVSEILSRWNATADEPIRPSYNIAPTQETPIITIENQGKIIIAKWGLIPFWSKDPKMAYSTINAKAETLQEKPAYREAFKKRRCLVLADGFYEWKKTGNQKIPFRIHVRSEKLFSFAGIYENSKDASGNIMPTFSIITVPPNPLMKNIHDRMPAILRKENEKRWLSDLPVKELIEDVLRPYPAEDMKAYQISTLVNSPTNNDEAVIRPIQTLTS